jgi:hypothetical protein
VAARARGRVSTTLATSAKMARYFTPSSNASTVSCGHSDQIAEAPIHK